MRKKMLLAVVCVLLLVSTTPADPGDTLWTRTYGGSNDEGASSVQQTADGGYIIAGGTYSFGAGDADFYLVKTDASADTLWTRTYGGSAHEAPGCVQQTRDGGYIVAGYTTSFGAGGYDVYLVKTDSSGDTIWTRTYGGSSDDAAYSVQQTSDGGYIIAGYTRSFGAGGYDVYLLKTDSSGDTLWARTYGGSSDDYAESVQQTTDCGYIVAGVTSSFGAGGEDFYLVKTDASGDSLWTRTYGGNGNEHASAVQQTTDGGYILAGYTSSFGAGYQDFYLVKTDVSGHTLWARTYGGSDYDGAWSAQQTTDGGYILAGSTGSFGAGMDDFYVVKANASGDTLWTRTYGGSGSEAAQCMQQTSDGGYVVTGHTTSFGAGGRDFYLVRVAGKALILTIVPSDTLVAHNDSLCYHLICHNHTPDYLQLSFKVEVRLPNGQMYGPIFGPARFGMFGNGISEGDMCHRVPPQAPVGDYWLFAEVYNAELSARDSMAFTVTGDGQLANAGSAFGDWQTVLARLGGEDLISGAAETRVPAQFVLQGNYPNPFNATTAINYQLPVNAHAKLEVYNILGETVATLVNDAEEAGYKSVTWDASEIASGIYFYKLTAGDYTETKRMMLVK